ncbi:MAG: AAA family ATPase, partial [Thermoplasmatota archaeon]
GALPAADAEWSSTVFEEQIIVERSPDHLVDRAPFNGESLYLKITSRSNQMINAANVWVWVYFEGALQTEGAFSFTKINQTAMEAQITGYPGGYNVQYEINAFDERNSPIKSTRYSYNVIENGSWVDTDFENNIILEWGPKEPKNGQGITINITSRDPLVAIQRADLLYTVTITDQDPVDGVVYFERVNSTVMTAKIITYPPGTRINFYVQAFDQYLNDVISNNQIYEYPKLPVLDPVYQGILFAIFKDEAANLPANGARVVFYNETYEYETTTVNGMAFTNKTVYQGEYRIDVTYKGKKNTFTVEAPTDTGSFTFNFGVNKKTYQVMDGEEERPYIREVVGLVLAIVVLLAASVGAVKIKDLRESINEKRKKARKKTEKKEEPNWLEKILMDEETKEKVVRCAGIFILSMLGLFWAPFFPWWMVIILSLILTGTAIKYPYISLLAMAVFVTASTSYQSTELGWIFLIFSLVVMIGGFFDWRYAYFSFLTVFAAGYGLGFMVPMIAAVTFSLFLGSVVLVTAGIFLLVVAPSGTFQWFSFLAVTEHSKSFVRFDKGVDPNWSPIDVVNVLGDLAYADTQTISTVLQDTMGSLVPLFGLLGWGAAMVALFLIFERWLDRDARLDTKPMNWLKRLIPACIIFIFGIISILWAEVDLEIWLVFPFLAVIPASLVPFGLRALGEEALPLEYGVEEVHSSDVGKKISEMVGFRKASFKEIGGLEDVKREVKNALMVPLLEPEMATKYGVKPSKGIMLFGPPGCGKTLMLRAVASDLNVEMIGIKCSDVMSKWYGESENLIASLFEEAKARSPCILFLDEIDSIAKRRDFYSTDDVTPRVLSIMLSEMDGMDEAEGIIVVATTNMPDLVDPALMRPGRFDKVIYVPPPDGESRKEIIRIHLKDKFTGNDIDTNKVAQMTDGFSGADLANLVREASSLGLERALETKKPEPITMSDIQQILDEIKPSITPKMIRMYDKLRREYERKKRGSYKEESEEEAPAEKKPEKRGIPGPPAPPKKFDPKKKEKIVEMDEVGSWEED